ncbi:hypothetical protein [Furfurilactobacillus cerevisiae]|uniref:hypothetical protein n=1 Tax=Furfurilactobacillus rossiae TaxID=231049 RepID=UPI003B97D5C1
MADIGKVFPTLNGTWSATTQYERMSVVFYQGASYMSTNNTLSDEPDKSSNWQKMADKGDVGKDGDLGRLGGDVIPINQFTAQAPNLSINDDGTPETALQNYSPGYSYEIVSPKSDGKYHLLYRDFTGQSGTLKVFFYTDKRTADKSVTKDITGTDFTLKLDDLIDASDIGKYGRVGIASSHGMSQKVALYSEYVDLDMYLPPINKILNDDTGWISVDGSSYPNNTPEKQYGGVRYRVLGQVVTIEFYIDHIATGNAFNIPPEYALGVPIWGNYSRGGNVRYSLETDGSFNIDAPAAGQSYDSNSYLSGVITYLVG